MAKNLKRSSTFTEGNEVQPIQWNSGTGQYTYTDTPVSPVEDKKNVRTWLYKNFANQTEQKRWNQTIIGAIINLIHIESEAEVICPKNLRPIFESLNTYKRYSDDIASIGSGIRVIFNEGDFDFLKINGRILKIEYECNKEKGV